MENEKCAYCGEGRQKAIKDTNYDDVYIHCYTCGADGPFRTEEIEAWAAWNARPAEDKLLDEIEQLKDQLEHSKRQCDALAYAIDQIVEITDNANE